MPASRDVRVLTPGNAKDPGDDLFSRKAALSVSSALESLTAVFGMGTGVASPLESPGSICVWSWPGCDRSTGPEGTRTRGAKTRSSIVSVSSSQISMIHDHDPSH